MRMRSRLRRSQRSRLALSKKPDGMWLVRAGISRVGETCSISASANASKRA
jgi:hypothetical protein